MINWKAIEKKWQSKWKESGIFESDPDPEKEKYYLTVAYPYPNSPQHIGHGRTYTLTDVHARLRRMQGYNVLLPMAWHYTGTPLFAMVERLKDKDPEIIDTFHNLYNIPTETLSKLEDPISMATYFADEIKHGMERMGYSIDWRREFTTIDEKYNKFIEWQFKKLRDMGYITQGSHPVGWCLHCGNPVGQHDTVGDKEPEIEEFTLIKFRKGEVYYPAATLRPETIFGVTNMWINPEALYVEAKVDKEIWVISAYAANKLKLLGYDVKIKSEFQGSRLIGQTLVNPANENEILVLPASFVDPNNATGVVMSVPSHAPFDFVALEQLKRNFRALAGDYNIRQKDVNKIEPISIISVPGYAESPAMDVVRRREIKDQNDPNLEDATREVYSQEFHNGRMRGNTNLYVNLSVQQAKEAVEDDMIQMGTAITMYELTEPVQCRCGTEVVVKIFENQWFINYGNPRWKELAHQNIDSMMIIPLELRQEFKNVVDWLKAKACARRAGLGTKLPWAKDWIIEALSDSVIYMAYYTVIKGINEIDPDAEVLNEAFWDYIFLDEGNPEEVEEETGFPAEKLEELREEFNYFYPLDARHSGRDLISNHLTYMVFIHDAIWPQKKWPKGIVVNGSVLMEGEKMSKSLNNIIPLIDAIETFGADPLRLSLMITAEPLKDADFSPDLAKNMQDNLERFYDNALEVISNGGTTKEPEMNDLDRWMISKLQGHILEANDAMEEMKIRKTIHTTLYDLKQDMDWYRKRVEAERTNGERKETINNVERRVLETQIKMLNPFIPHLCEEIWEKMGYDSLVALEDWPKEDQALIRKDSEELESIIQAVLEDVQNIIKVTGIDPSEIHFYTADGWKWKIYKRALELKNEGKLDVGTLIRNAFKDDENKARVEQVPSFARGVVDELQKIPRETLEIRLKLGTVNEVKLLQDAAKFFRKEFNAEIKVGGESDPWIEDPADRAKRARPYRPAIYVE
jgi:leucyl-tRNA synthetase